METVTTVLKMFILFISIFHRKGEAPYSHFFASVNSCLIFNLVILGPGMYIFTKNYCYISGERTTEY